jgi:hypothetical protein
VKKVTLYVQIYFFLVILCLLFTVASYGQHSTPGIDEAYHINNLDSLNHIPQWLMVQVKNALPSKGLNVWVPTNSFGTSSLVRVPRFPPRPMYTSHPIRPVKNGSTLDLQAVRNEQVSAQLAVAATDSISDLKAVISD